jgi:uncharacterized protein YutE (UPF0331/DUF86 family)
MTEKKILQDFVEDLTFLMEKNHINIVIPCLSMWAEYVINKLINQKLGSKLEKERDFTSSLKLQILRKLDIIDEAEFKTLDALRRSRNLLLHEGVTMNRKKFDSLLDKTELNSSSKNMEKDWKNNVPLNTRFLYACYSKIFRLLQKVECDYSTLISIYGGKAHLEKALT